jgi:plastocyanin
VRRVAIALAACVLVPASLVAASLGQARTTTRRVHVCHRSHHRRVCRWVRIRRAPKPTTVTTTSSSSSSTTTSASVTTTTTTTASIATTTTSTTTSASLPHGTAVGERATGESSPFYALDANERTLAAGVIHFNIYNYDQDPHTFAVADANGQQVSSTVNVPAGQPTTAQTLTVDLPPGTYTLFCTLPQHAALGMKTTITVR